ncbi:hypothetical protein HUT18_24690 [Streptomyces sp. NA04227]|nr:hypothetical protein HUT18_24690 [Streptomyces sp. NA04227]
MNDTDHRERSGNPGPRENQRALDGVREVPDSGRSGDRSEDDGAEEARAQQCVADLDRALVPFGLGPS